MNPLLSPGWIEERGVFAWSFEILEIKFGFVLRCVFLLHHISSLKVYTLFFSGIKVTLYKSSQANPLVRKWRIVFETGLTRLTLMVQKICYGRRKIYYTNTATFLKLISS